MNRTPGSSFAFYMGGSSSGKIVNERSAMQMTAVYACVRILSEAIAGLPLHLYRYKEDGGKDKATGHPLYLLLHDEPNPEMSSFVFRETLMTHLLLYGNAYAQIIRNGKGEVVGLYPLMANKMSVNRDANGQLYYQYQRSSDEAHKNSEGFASKQDVTLASVPMYREGRHGSERWANLATFSEATDLFRFRTIPDVTVTTCQHILCDGERFDIISVENVGGRGMYIEVLAKKVVSSRG